MFLKQDSSFILQAQLTGTVASSQVEISVTYKDNTNNDYSDVIVATNNTTAVTLLTAPPTNTVNLVELIKIYNPDIQANTIEILAGSTVVYTCTVGAKSSAMISNEGVSNGLGFIPLAVDGDGSRLTGITTDQITDTADKRFITDTEKSNYDMAYTNSHTHSNKTLLDNLTSNGDGNSYLANDGIYKSAISGGVCKFNALSIISDDFTLTENYITTGYVSGNYTLTLPTITDTEKQVVCVFDFTTSGAGYPVITNTNLRWSDKNNGITPASWSLISGVHNVLTFKSIWVGSTLYWEAEYTTYGLIETTFTQPALSADGTLGGTSFAVSASSYYDSSYYAFKGVDNNSSTSWALANGQTTGYYILYNPVAVKASSISITNRGVSSYAITGYTLYGSNDGTNYTALITGTNSVTSASSNWDINIPSANRAFYKYYKIYISSSDASDGSGFTQATINGVYIAS